MTRLTTLADAEAVSERAALEIVQSLQGARRARGVAHLALSGGTTPARTYELLAGEMPDWDGVHVWFADERCVGPRDEQSNFRLAHEALLGPAGIPPERIHRMEGELGPEEGAQRYAQALREGVPADRHEKTAAKAGGETAAGAGACRHSTWSSWESARTAISPRCFPARPRWTPASRSCAFQCATPPSPRPTGSP